jgi:6-phosphogluconolactonase
MCLSDIFIRFDDCLLILFIKQRTKIRLCFRSGLISEKYVLLKFNFKTGKMKRIITICLIGAIILPFYAQKNEYRLLIGTYTNTGKSKGIYTYDINMKKGDFRQKSVADGISNPSYLAITPDKKYVYSVNESSDGSAASAFSFDEKNGKLRRLNSSFTRSDSPCYISVTPNHVFTANYGGGSISVFGRQFDGALTELLQLIQHVGKSVNTERQNEPHVHQVLLSPDQKYLVANDLGTDNVTVYKYNPDSSTEILIPLDTLAVKPGSGPRHAVFSRDGKKLFLVQEIDGTVSVLKMEDGKLSLMQETTVDYKPGTVNRAADIHLSPDGKFLYVTNRGTANDITCFSVSANGKLNFIQQIATRGDGPRNFAITPDGKYVFVAHQFTDNITVFKRDKKTGKLTDTGKRIEVGAPVCLVIY